MRAWERPHWSGRPRPKSDRQRLKPNIFARLVRVSAKNSGTVFITVLFLAALAASFATLSLRFDPDAPPRIALDAQTREAQKALDRSFPGIETSFVAQIELERAEDARNRALSIAAALSRRTNLFADAFVPGTDAFYTQYAILFRDAADVESAVERTLQMQPLYHALASAPDLAGLAALVGEIGRALQQGRSPPGLAGLLLAAAAAVEGEIGGASRPIDWAELAGLTVPMESKRWFVIATPLPGKETEATSFATATAGIGPDLQWYFPPGLNKNAQVMHRDLLFPTAASLLILFTILSLGLGTAKFAIPVVATALAALCLTAGFAAAIAPDLDAVTWTFAPLSLWPASLFGIVIVLAHVQSRLRGADPLTAIMLAAQRRWPLLLALGALAQVFWVTWFFRQLPSQSQAAVVGSFGVAIGLLLSLTLLPATLGVLDRGGDVERHWLDKAAARPLGFNLRNGRQILVLLIVAASVFCVVFVPGLRFGDAPRNLAREATLDTPVAEDAVHFLASSEEAASDAVGKLSKLPQTGSVRWAEQFLPLDAKAKLQHLRRLDGFLSGLSTPQPSADTTLAAAFAALEAGFRQISGDPAAAPDLREASHRLRRALGLYANPDLPPPARVKALEAALFGGLGNLSRTAAQLAGLASPTVADLDQALRRRFISAEGSWRIEVLPKPGVRRLVFAGAMRRFSPGAAGEPVVALARSEIIHHEAALAMAIAFAAAAIAALLYLRDVWDWIIAVFPMLFATSLSAAVAAATGQIVLHSALAGLMPAMAACLSMSIMLVLWERQSRESATARDISIRAAVLPPLACLGIALPLMMSAHPAMAAVGNASALFLIAAMAVNLIVVPQACGWVEALRGPLVKPASSGRAFSRRGRASP